MLDTNTVSFILTKRSLAAVVRLTSLSEDEMNCISAITAGELFYGLKKGGNNENQLRKLNEFLQLSQVSPWNQEAALVYGTLRARQEAAGNPLQALDTQIAAHALTLGATLVTHDKAFRHIDGLSTEDWATDR